MSTSLSRLKSQIAKLQKQAANIESGIVSRIKAEIAKHGLTAEQLFGASPTGGVTLAAAKPKATVKAGAARAAKFADDAGNTWGGMGKRPQWIRAALEAGKSLDDFLVAGKKVAATKTAPTNVKGAPAKKAKVAKKAAPAKQVAAKKAAAAKTTDAPVAAKRAAKAAVKKSAVKKPAKKRAAAAPAGAAQGSAA